jgi:hypothetical protein
MWHFNVSHFMNEYVVLLATSIVLSSGCQGQKDETPSDRVGQGKSRTVMGNAEDRIVVFKGGAGYGGIAVSLNEAESDGFIRIVSRRGRRERFDYNILAGQLGQFHALGRTYVWHIGFVGDFTDSEYPTLWHDPAFMRAFDVLQEEPITSPELVRRAMATFKDVAE